MNEFDNIYHTDEYRRFMVQKEENISDFSVIDDYASSWKFIAKELHSLERFSNLGLCFTPKQEE